MSIQLARAEFWLLDAAVHDPTPIRGLMNRAVAERNNTRDHGCVLDEIARGLQRLFVEGLILCDSSEGRRKPRRLTRGAIDAALRSAWKSPRRRFGFLPGPRYRLTPEGGAVWEEFLHPRWEMHLADASTIFGAGHGRQSPYPAGGRVICTRRSSIEAYLKEAHFIGYEIRPETIRWDLVSPWRATYWKTLPLAHQVRFRMLYHEAVDYCDQPRVAARMHVYESLRAWRRW